MSTQTLSPPRVGRPPEAVAAPVSGWRRLAGDWVLVGGTTAICHVLGAATSLLLRFLLSPAQMGVWQAVKLLLSYGNYTNLGISKGAVRDYTIARGAGRTSAARRGLNVAFSVNTITSVLYGGLLVGLGFWIGSGEGVLAGAWRWGLITVGLVTVVSRYVTYHVTILRARQDFVITSRLSVLEGVVTLVAGGLATWLWGLMGLYAATAVVLAWSLWYIARYREVALAWTWDGPEIRRLIGVGAPILLAGTVGSLFRSLDKVMILAYLPDREHQLGCYSLALMVGAQLFGLGNMFSIVLGPRFGEAFGATGSRRDVARLVARTSEFQAAAVALPAALALVLGAPILGRILPEYQSGLPPLRWLLPGVMALTLALPVSQYMLSVHHERRALWAVLSATGLAALGNHAALVGGFGLSGVALATTTANIVYLLLLLGMSLWGELPPADRLRYVAMNGLAIVPTLAAALCLSPDQGAPLVRLIAPSLTVTTIWILSVALGWRLGGWREKLRGEI